MENYLDNSATTAVSPQAAQVVYDVLTNKYGNPSSLHRKGLEAELLLKAARETVAGELHVPAETIHFTSGGTEANNIALFGAVALQRKPGARLVATAIEHDSVLATLKELGRQGYEVVLVSPDSNGEITPQAMAEAVDENTILVSAMAVNNELGTVLDTAFIAREVKRKNPNVIVHCDAVQAFCKVPLRFGFGYTDMVTVTGHKIHAPKGVGALYVNKRIKLPPRAFGGHQENGLRPGTQASALIAGFGEAIKLCQKDAITVSESVKQLNALLKERLVAVSGVVINSPDNALPYILNLSVPGIRSEIMMHFLEERGIYVSSGSACAQGAKSHVLTAAGFSPERIDSALRVSLCRYNTAEDIDSFVDALAEGIASIRRA